MTMNLIRAALACAVLAAMSIAVPGAQAQIHVETGSTVKGATCPPGDCMAICGKQTCAAANKAVTPTGGSGAASFSLGHLNDGTLKKPPAGNNGPATFSLGHLNDGTLKRPPAGTGDDECPPNCLRAKGGARPAKPAPH